MRKRKYKVNDKLVPKEENMFWEKYVIEGINDKTGGNSARTHGEFSYFVKCIPFNKERYQPVVLEMLESVIIKTTNIMEEEIEYNLHIVGEYLKGGIKVSVTEKDNDTGMEFPFATASVWTQGAQKLEEDEFVLKNYSENEVVEQMLLSNDIIALTGETMKVGRNDCPVVKLTGKTTWYEKR